MALFSEREGIRPRKALQIDGMDQDLRNDLWNAFIYFILRVTGHSTRDREESEIMTRKIWMHFFNLPFHDLYESIDGSFGQIRKRFFQIEWYRVYDIIEFSAAYCDRDEMREQFINACNGVLKRQVSAYRFVNGKIAQITSDQEISEIEEALQGPYQPVNGHLSKALGLLSDRENPDYSNSIKESISAIESMCRIISQKEKAKLSDALDIIEKEHHIHHALKSAFDKLYGYASDEGGIRHGAFGESEVGFDEAKFMLVSCLAFVNYLISKTPSVKDQI
ncbi:MAG TPA: hypothetical protein PLQ35_09185 [bacterium]|nr:hypothetical protein [bacterium]HQL62455.1 hypothetical protein [bacterium]